MKMQDHAITFQEQQDREMGLLSPEGSLEGAEACISQCLKEAARNVIAVGYYLKHIRDNRLFEAAGYQNIWEYARERYGFSMSTASRYMSRNDKFSAGGNSPVLDERYRGYGKAQLQEMLSLDEEQLERITPDMTVQQIREVRREKEVPYVEIPGQMNIADFPAVLPEEGGEEAEEAEPPTIPKPGRASLCISDICSECEEGAGRIVAAPQFEAGEEAGSLFAEACVDACLSRTIKGYTVAEPAEYSREMLAGMIRDEKETLALMGDYWRENMAGMYTAHAMMLRAYENLLEEHDRQDETESCEDCPGIEAGQQEPCVIRFTICKNAELSVQVSEKMKEDFRQCIRGKEELNGEIKDCEVCSWWGKNIGHIGLCEIMVRWGR